jgi:hypothetical protein
MPEHRSKTFFDLPFEIREQIYCNLFRGIVVSPASYVRAQTSKPTGPFIFRVCRACYDEARPVFLQTACFSLGGPSLGYQPETQDEMKRKVGAFQLHLIQHLRVPLPYTYESWSNDLTAPYRSLKTLTIAVGQSHIGATSLPSEPMSAEYMREMIDNGEQSHKTKDSLWQPLSMISSYLCGRRQSASSTITSRGEMRRSGITKSMCRRVPTFSLSLSRRIRRTDRNCHFSGFARPRRLNRGWLIKWAAVREIELISDRYRRLGSAQAAITIVFPPFSRVFESSSYWIQIVAGFNQESPNCRSLAHQRSTKTTVSD